MAITASPPPTIRAASTCDPTFVASQSTSAWVSQIKDRIANTAAAITMTRPIAIVRTLSDISVRNSANSSCARSADSCNASPTSVGMTPDRVTTDGHDSYPRAIRTELGKAVRHRTSAYLNNRLEQDHRGIKGRYRSMRGFKCPRSAARFCRAYDELRNFFRPRSRHHQHVPADRRRLLHLRRTATVLAILQAA